MTENTALTWGEFERVDLRVGTIVNAESFPEARRPAWKVTVDLGELGLKKSSAQITERYEAEDLVGKQVLCVCNFPPKQIANMMSEVLVTGFEVEGGVVLLSPDQTVPNGTRLR